MVDIHFLSASELVTHIQEHSLTIEEILLNLLERIEIINEKINALVYYNKENLLSQAKEADKKLKNTSNIAPLHGLPISIKDNIEVQNMITTGGIGERKDYIPSFDAPVVQRLKDAGAIILGKTNCPAFCAGWETENAIYGRTNNPYNLEHTVGSSSGGEAALIAAGGSYVGIGSDTGGSIRWPSVFTGIASLVPTFGRVPRTGTIPPYLGYIDTSQIGPLARSIKDLALIFPHIMGPDNWDSRCLPLEYTNPVDITLEKLNIAYYAENGFVEPIKEIKQTIYTVAQKLEEKDLIVEENCPTATKEFSEVSQGLNSFAAKIEKQTYPTINEWTDPVELYPQNILNLSGEWLAKAKQAKGSDAMLGIEFFFWGFKWDTYRTKILQFMNDYDAIICPVVAKPAFKHGEPQEETFNPLDYLTYTHPYSLVGLPSVTLRGGTTAEGLPVGFQIITKHAQEGLALKLGLYLEEQLGGWKKPLI